MVEMPIWHFILFGLMSSAIGCLIGVIANRHGDDE